VRKKGVSKERDTEKKEEVFSRAVYLQFKEKGKVAIKYKAFSEDLIKEHYFKTLGDTKEILHYRDGFYQFGGEEVIEKECEKTFGEFISRFGINEIIGHVQRSTYIEREEVNQDPLILNLKNGLYNLKTFEFSEHTPDIITTTRLPVLFDPNAKCPKIEKFLREIVSREDIQLLKEIPGYCLYRSYFIRKAVMLVGGGGNGKSTYLNLLKAFLGKNYSTASLQDLVSNRFSTASLFGKLANIYPDLSPKSLVDTGKFKILTGCDAVDGEKKFKDCFNFENFAKLLFSANTVPISHDSSKAFFDRWIIINFPFEFNNKKDANNGVKKADKKIIEKITTQEELSGFLNLALKGLQRLLKNSEFSYNKKSEEIEEEYLRLSNNIYGFVHDWCELDVKVEVLKSELYNAYVNYCKLKRQPPMTNNKFGRELPRQATVTETHPRVAGRQQEAWRGIKLKDNIYDNIYYKDNTYDKNNSRDIYDSDNTK